jgi:hypothetical protein
MRSGLARGRPGSRYHSKERLPRYSYGAILTALAVATLILPANLVLAAAGLSPTFGTAAGGLDWTKLFPTIHPPPLVGMALAYDVKDGYVVGFGGDEHNDRPHNQTWTFTRGNWTEVYPVVSPPAQGATFMTYDNASRQVILLASTSVGTGTATPNWTTWAYSGGTWSQLRPNHEPIGYQGSMAYDPLSKSVVFLSAVLSKNYSTVGETWIFNGSDWSHWNGAGTPLANPVGLAYDPTVPGLIMVGQVNASSYANNVSTWVLKNRTWTPLSVVAEPSAITNAGFQTMTYDASAGYLFLTWSTIGQVLSGGLGNGRLEQPWKFQHDQWTKLTPANDPTGRVEFGMTYDAADGYVVQFGGHPISSAGGELNQTWTCGP